MAGRYKVCLVMGVIERDRNTLYCTVVYYDAEGRYLGKHRKLQPTALERTFWGFGDASALPVFQTSVGKIGAAICYESRMPLLRMAMYGKGVEIFCVPTGDPTNVWQASMAHIAAEGGCFVLSATQFLRRKDFPRPPEFEMVAGLDDVSPDTVLCAGGSVIISPSGATLARPNYEGEGLISADLDMGEIVRAKMDFDVVGHYARPQILSLTVREVPKELENL